MSESGVPNVDTEVLREAIRGEYHAVATSPNQGFHFHTGRAHAKRMGYEDAWLDGVPEGSVDSFAGTGNPFSIGVLQHGERVVDIACGAGIDSLIAAAMVGPSGAVVGVDMTPAMLDKARLGARAAGLANVEFIEGLGESLPVPDSWADVVISNGSINLMPDKLRAFGEIHRVLREGGRLQVADILVQKAVPENAKERIDLWTG
jgi:SAM-dependent methyltransferase